MEKIAILLPGITFKVSGGYKVVYDYADELSRIKNYDVDFLYIHFLPGDSFLRIIKKYLKFILAILIKYKPWYKFKYQDFKHIPVLHLKKSNLNRYSIVICSSSQTAIAYNKIEDQKQFIYFIQGYETFSIREDLLINSYKYKNALKITVSNFLKKILEKEKSNVVSVLPNPIDKSTFSKKKNYFERNKNSICFMYSAQPVKNSEGSIELVEGIRNKMPDVLCTAFGTFRKPPNFPKWINYVYNPSPDALAKIYNDHKVFLSTSISEGFSLTNAEAMACGACVVTTDSGGNTDFCVDRETAYLIDINKYDKNINLILKILNNGPKMGLIKNAVDMINSYDIKKNTRMLDEIIQKNKNTFI